MIPVGTSVKMSERGKDTYRDGMYNPHNSFEVVISSSGPGDYIYEVTWVSDTYNNYRVDEIEPAGPINLEDLM